MKKLILSLFLLSSHLYAANISTNEMVDPDDGKRIVSAIKDLQVEDMLNKTREFKDCRDHNKFEAGDDEPKRTVKIKAAEACIKAELAKGDKSGEKLKKLSEDLNLQDYGLVQSKNVSDIQNYLANKMYKSLTGVDRNEKDLEKLAESKKFKNKKQVDQKVFVEMYRTQLGKNALFEISRFCFENFRSTKDSAKNASNFFEHWDGYNGKLDISEINDLGDPKFGTTLSGPDDKQTVYAEIFKSIQGNAANLSDEQMSAFFMECGKFIVPLCKKFKEQVDITTAKSQVDATPSVGANACLTQSRLQNYRKALKDTQLVEDQFNKELAADKNKYNLSLAKVNKFESGQNNNETLDELTNYTSKDFLDGGYSKGGLAEKKAEKCEKNPELSTCEDFLTQGDDFEKAKRNIEMELTIKREVEMSRVRKFDKESLKKYLEDNGYLELLKKYDANELKEADIADEIGRFYEAKKIATLEQINLKLGKRQVAKDASDADIKDAAISSIKTSKEERSRLAQVVLFNNIITSHLLLKKANASGTLESAGRNVNAWKKEEKELSDSRVQSDLFENMKKSTAGVTGLGSDNQLSGFGMIDLFIGKD